jgi:hypothetical protein
MARYHVHIYHDNSSDIPHTHPVPTPQHYPSLGIDGIDPPRRRARRSPPPASGVATVGNESCTHQSRHSPLVLIPPLRLPPTLRRLSCPPGTPDMLPPSLPPCFRGLETVQTVGNPPGWFPGPPAAHHHPPTRSFASYSLSPPHPSSMMVPNPTIGVCEAIAEHPVGPGSQDRSQSTTVDWLLRVREFGPLVRLSLFYSHIFI